MTKDKTNGTQQCMHIIRDSSTGTKRQCRLKAKEGDYCGKHVNHAARRQERAVIGIDKARSKIAEDILGVLKDIAMNEDVSPGDRIRASIAYLDRTGYAPTHLVKADDLRREIEAEIAAIDDADGGTEPA